MIAIIDYDAGNTKSVINALKRLGAEFILTDENDKILSAEKVIFPGVGHAYAAMQRLSEKGLIPVLTSCKKPFLGICLGMQLLFDHSQEGNTKCLGIVPGEVKAFKIGGKLKVPHMGWNTNEIYNQENASLFKGLEHCETYFVHSYYAEICAYTSAVCDYQLPFSSAVQKDNFFGVQFHPEKSGRQGEQILDNFLRL